MFLDARRTRGTIALLLEQKFYKEIERGGE